MSKNNNIYEKTAKKWSKITPKNTEQAKKCQKMEIIKTQNLNFSQKTHQKTPLLKPRIAAFWDKVRRKRQ